MMKKGPITHRKSELKKNSSLATVGASGTDQPIKALSQDNH